MSRKFGNVSTEKHKDTQSGMDRISDYADHVRTVVHDLKSPLTSIMLKVDFIKKVEGDKLSDKTCEYLEQIRQASLLISTALEQLLRPGEPDKTTQAVEILPIIQTILQAYELQLKNRGITVIVSPDLYTTLAHPERLTAVFTNLIGNAIKYIGDENTNPIIRIQAFRQGDVVRYEVQDNGVGINPDDQPHVFEPHTRFHGDLASGSGLGLAIVESMATKLGGQVGVDSKPDHGSTFWFTLPPNTRH